LPKADTLRSSSFVIKKSLQSISSRFINENAKQLEITKIPREPSRRFPSSILMKDSPRRCKKGSSTPQKGEQKGINREFASISRRYKAMVNNKFDLEPTKGR
jgi:hypothetical protein